MKVFVCLVLSLIAGTAIAQNAKGPVKVFILAGQDAMTGYGVLGELTKPADKQRGTLVQYIRSPKNLEKYKHLYAGPKKDKKGWTVRDDVFITTSNGKQGGLTAGQGGAVVIPPHRLKRFDHRFGPEFAIGHALGDHYDETVLLVKLSYDSCSLGYDFRPPSSGGDTGEKYKALVVGVIDALKGLPKLVPGYEEETGYELVGLFWNQGCFDMQYQYAVQYEKNLSNLIKDLRKDLKAPKLKAVVATTGYGGWKNIPSTHPIYRKVIDAQLAVGKLAEFKGSVATVETRSFYRDRTKFGGKGDPFVWYCNGESYWLIGEAMGNKMVALIDPAKAPKVMFQSSGTRVPVVPVKAPALPDGPVKIFLLTGQSNMTGRGAVGSLDRPAAEQKATLVRYIKEPKNVAKYKALYNGKTKDKNGWTIRDDVFISWGTWPHVPGQARAHFHKHGGLAPCYGGRRGYGTGPELGFGFVLGEFYKEPVLLVKIAFGGNSLGGNFRPPSSGGKLGDKYPITVKCLRDTIANLPEVIPGYTKERGYEIVGLLWNQGEHDMMEPKASEYQKNMANLIRDLRKEFKTPKLLTVIQTTGYLGWKGKPTTDPVASKVIKAQLAIPNLPEFKGTVATTETRDFWRDRETYGGRGMTIHWCANGESYFLMGEASGHDMIKLIKADTK